MCEDEGGSRATAGYNESAEYGEDGSRDLFTCPFSSYGSLRNSGISTVAGTGSWEKNLMK